MKSVPLFVLHEVTEFSQTLPSFSDLFVIRISETLKLSDPNLIQVDDFKNDQLLCLTVNLLLFIRSQIPVTKKLFQSCEFTQNNSEMLNKSSKLCQGSQLLSEDIPPVSSHCLHYDLTLKT